MNNEERLVIFLAKSKQMIANFGAQVSDLLTRRQSANARVVIRRVTDRAINDNDLQATRSFFTGLLDVLDEGIHQSDGISRIAGMTACRWCLDHLFATATRDGPSYLESMRIGLPVAGPAYDGVEIDIGFHCSGDDIIVRITVGLDDGTPALKNVRRILSVNTYCVAQRVAAPSVALPGAEIISFPKLLRQTPEVSID